MHDSRRLAEPDGFPLLNLTERMREQREHITATEPVILEDVVTAVLDTMTGRLSPTESILLKEIAGLAHIIDQAKADVAGVTVDSITGRHIPSATGELDAIVEHTALATKNILESCELLETLASSLDSAHAQGLESAVTQIYEACIFHDITGQRITKVVKALQAIERKVREMAGGQIAGFSLQPDTSVEAGSLLNGPACRPRQWVKTTSTSFSAISDACRAHFFVSGSRSAADYASRSAGCPEPGAGSSDTRRHGSRCRQA
jgi:chemotaxis protein CheZ